MNAMQELGKRKTEDDMKLVKFLTKNGWIFGTLNTDTMEITFPSGYQLPVMENGYVSYMGETCQVLDINGNPIV